MMPSCWGHSCLWAPACMLASPHPWARAWDTVALAGQPLPSGGLGVLDNFKALQMVLIQLRLKPLLQFV